MRAKIGLCAFILLGCIAAVPATARVLVYTGPCAGTLGENWAVVITVDDNTGAVTRREGVGCNGEHWIGQCDILPLPRDPGKGSGYYESGMNWWVRCDIDASGRMIAMWGKDVSGTYWRIDTTHDLLS
jgi:hypothetical protein